MTQRIAWIDQIKGMAIFLIVYGHNAPITGKYIYSFHVPLFFIIAGFFHPKISSLKVVKTRAKKLLVPYFIWSLLLYLICFFIGRKFGTSKALNLSPIDNFMGILYAQGGEAYMDWGIPMWFLPAIFVTYLIFSLVLKIRNLWGKITCLILLPSVGYLLSMTQFNYLWSFDIALVSLIFYSFGYYAKKTVTSNTYKTPWLLVLLLGLTHLYFFNKNIKIDMYQSVYGSFPLFIFNGLTGALFIILLLKKIPTLSILEQIGKTTIPILALHIRTLSFLKTLSLILLGYIYIELNEIEKIILTWIQLALIYPITIGINKYLPILNGNYNLKNNEQLEL